MKEKFINLIKNEIFALDKELNFGVYKIFKQSKNQIDKLLEEIAEVDEEIREDIYNYLYNFFSLYYESGDFGYTKRAFATFIIPYTHKEFQIESKNKCFNESSHSFFYDGEEIKFTWRTEDSYYIKSNKYFNNIEIKVDNINIVFKINSVDNDFDSKKGRLFRLLKGEKIDDKLILYFNISNIQTPKHSIYLFIKYMIDNNIQSLDYVLNKDFEQIPPKNTLFNNFDIDKYKKYLFENNKLIFKEKASKDEEKTQIFSFNSLYIPKKDYASKVYTKTEAKEKVNKTNFNFDDKKDLDKLFKKDKLLNFFYKLDRGFNNFLAGVDSDYFIHKNLKRFLLVELDKFIKNYVFSDTNLLLLEDEETQKLRKKAKIFKEKAEKLIEFLSAVEEFQKYIWEKRKIIKEVNFIVSSNRIEDKTLLEKILKNESQINEWEELGLCENISSSNELREKPYPVDTKYFDEEFKIKLLSSFEDLEEEIDGILINSENFQALKFLEKKFKERIKCIYIDPPYNTGNDGFVYKDNYQEASWLSMMNDRLRLAKELMRDDGVIFSSINNREVYKLKLLMDNIFVEKNFIEMFKWNKTSTPPSLSKIRAKYEYILCYEKQNTNKIFLADFVSGGDMPLLNESNQERELIFPNNKVMLNFNGYYKKGRYGKIELLEDIEIINGMSNKDIKLKGKFKWTQENLNNEIKEGTLFIIKTDNFAIRYIKNGNRIKKPSDIINKSENKVETNEEAKKEIIKLFNKSIINYPKPVSLILYLYLTYHL